MARALSATGNHTEAVVCWKSMIQSDKTNPSAERLSKRNKAAGDLRAPAEDVIKSTIAGKSYSSTATGGRAENRTKRRQ